VVPEEEAVLVEEGHTPPGKMPIQPPHATRLLALNGKRLRIAGAGGICRARRRGLTGARAVAVTRIGPVMGRIDLNHTGHKVTVTTLLLLVPLRGSQTRG
jgi:hypothetical protein